VVNSAADVPASNPASGVCETAPGNGVCTLRAAIQVANARPGSDNISFASSLPNPTTFVLSRVGAEDNALNGDSQSRKMPADAAKELLILCRPGSI
jgi:CSLREA domain-containing protein